MHLHYHAECRFDAEKVLCTIPLILPQFSTVFLVKLRHIQTFHHYYAARLCQECHQVCERNCDTTEFFETILNMLRLSLYQKETYRVLEDAKGTLRTRARSSMDLSCECFAVDCARARRELREVQVYNCWLFNFLSFLKLKFFAEITNRSVSSDVGMLSAPDKMSSDVVRRRNVVVRRRPTSDETPYLKVSLLFHYQVVSSCIIGSNVSCHSNVSSN